MQHLPEPAIREPRITKLDTVDPVKLAEAYEKFLFGDETPDTLAVGLGIPKKLLLREMRQHKWLERKEELTRVLERESEQRYREFLARNRLPTADRHLRIAERLEKEIESAVAELGDLSGRDRSAAIRRLTESLASVTGVSARAAGITDRPAPVVQDGGQTGGRQPLILIGVQPRISDGSKVIDIREYNTEGADESTGAESA